MSGILNKKNRIIDYKLTENGRKQIQNGDINFKYYTLSDSSIVYSHDLESIDDKISNSENLYLPFEVYTEPLDYINPEFNLTNEVTFDNVNVDLLKQTESEYYRFLDLNAQNSVVEKITDKKYLNHKNILDENSFFSFKEKSVKKEFDFKLKSNSNNRFLLTYPTISSLCKDVTDLLCIDKDKRFSHKLNYQILVPENKDGTKIFKRENNEVVYLDRNPLHAIFKNLNFKSKVNIRDNRDSAIIKAINEISSLDEFSIFKNYYILNDKSDIKKYLFEMHEISENYGEEISISENTLTLGVEYKISTGFSLTRDLLIDLGFDNPDDYYNGKKITFVAKGTDKSRFSNNQTLVTQVFEELKKLAFVNLGEFYNDKTKNSTKVFLIGKIIHNEKSYSRNNIDFDYNDTSIKRNISTDYSFVNLFTLVLE
jgi:hypothetical protein